MAKLVHDHLPGSSKLQLHTTLARLQDVLRHHLLVQPLHVYDDLTIPPHVRVLNSGCTENVPVNYCSLVTSLGTKSLQQLVPSHAVNVDTELVLGTLHLRFQSSHASRELLMCTCTDPRALFSQHSPRR